VNSDVISMDMQVSLLYIDLHSFYICPRVVNQGHKVGLCLRGFSGGPGFELRDFHLSGIHSTT
jgi:hypothetical protein